MAELQIDRLSPVVGAEISGVDLAQISDDMLEDIRGALFENGVIFFRDQSLTPDQHIAFAERWGEIDVNRFFEAVDGYPKIAEVRKDPHQTTNIGGSWHTDHSYDPAPAMCSIVYGREIPEAGGDTMFASMTAAYESFSPGLKNTLHRLSAWHSDSVFSDEKDSEGRVSDENVGVDSLHPVIIAHPVTGRPAVYVNGDFTIRFDGWTEEESRPLLEYLYEACTRAEYCCRFRWQTGSMAIWDNRLVQHYAVNDYNGAARLLHRITIEGVPLNAAGEAGHA